MTVMNLCLLSIPYNLEKQSLEFADGAGLETMEKRKILSEYGKEQIRSLHLH